MELLDFVDVLLAFGEQVMSDGVNLGVWEFLLIVGQEVRTIVGLKVEVRHLGAFAEAARRLHPLTHPFLVSLFRQPQQTRTDLAHFTRWIQWIGQRLGPVGRRHGRQWRIGFEAHVRADFASGF